MPDVKISDSPAQLDQILRPLGITRSSKNYRVLCDCVALICEQEDRLEAVQKEIYTPISDQRRCKWSAIQSAVRRAAEKAWALNPEGVQQLAGYPLTGAPSAVQFLELKSSRFTVCPHWPLGNTPIFYLQSSLTACIFYHLKWHLSTTFSTDFLFFCRSLFSCVLPQ